jgi:dienelactone hydrolase
MLANARWRQRAPALAVAIAFVLGPGALADSPPLRDLNTPRAFPEIRTVRAWAERAREVREQVLVSCGLWPVPKRPPLRARIFGRIERDGYSIEKVFFQTAPGFYLAGNLYRPLGRGKGPFPAVLNPHGHWAQGRLTDTAEASVPGRCIQLARMGIVAFAYDMVGYNDTRFPDSLPPQGAAKLPFYHVHRQFATNRADQLWNISLMGLQTWNSIRALDFLESLPDVDRRRIGCTGASGGGTQTFILAAADERVAVSAPVCMVSHSMQGGCSCENAPGLRVRFSNMEIAAAAAPRPQILVAATGDWTKTTLEIEGPAIRHIYELLGASERLRYVRFDDKHNYNRRSREAVYAWLGRWLLDGPDADARPELPYSKEDDAALRVFPDGEHPPDALPMSAFIESLKRSHRKRWQQLVPHAAADFERFRRIAGAAWRHTLQLEEVELEQPARSAAARERPSVLIAAAAPDQARALALADALRQRAFDVRVWTPQAELPVASPFTNFFTTYNRTALQVRVGELIEECRQTREQRGGAPVVLCGVGRAGVWTLLAAPVADAVVADAAALDVTSDATLLDPELFCPGLRNIGTFEGGAMLAAPHPLLVHNTGRNFPTASLRAVYRALNAERRLRIESDRLSDAALAAWVQRLAF